MRRGGRVGRGQDVVLVYGNGAAGDVSAGPRPLRAGRRRVGRAPRGGRDALGLARRRAPPEPHARARLALDARVLLRSADARSAGSPTRPCSGSRTSPAPRRAAGRSSTPRATRSRAAGSTLRWSRRGARRPRSPIPTTRSSPPRCRSPRPASGDRVLVSVPGEMTVELARRTRAAALRAMAGSGLEPRGGGRLRQRVRLVPHDPGGVRGPALRGRHHRVRAGERRLHRLGARRPGRAARPRRGGARALPVRPHARAAARRPGISRAARARAASCASRARRGASSGRRSPGAAAPTGSTVRSSAPSCRCSAASTGGWRTVDDDRGLRILWRVDDDRPAGARHPGARRRPARHLPRLVGAAPAGARPGSYRFVVTATRYRLASRSFTLRPARSLRIAKLRAAPGRAGAGAALSRRRCPSATSRSGRAAPGRAP